MENKLHQIVYTRCSHHRKIENGAVSRSDGYGIFSMNKEFVEDNDDIDLQLISILLPKKNGAAENGIGLFNSYEYYPVSANKYAFTFEFAREKGKIPRKNGISHRPGNYVKQCLIGQAEGYPYEWFGSDIWDAWKVPENDYYLDDGSKREPNFLPLLSIANKGKGHISREKIIEFIRSGRQELLKCAVWFFITEVFGTNKNRVLFIKDYPVNVELWVAAIESCFPAEVARTISFSTNRSNISMADKNLFYYADKSGKYTQYHSNEATKKPFFMIAGIHPEDKFCSSIVPCSNLVMLDGVNKTFSEKTDETINSEYYNIVSEFGDDLHRFCTEIMPKFVLKNKKDIPVFFDSVKMLVNPEIISSLDYNSIYEQMSFFISGQVRITDSSVFIPMLDMLGKEYMRFIDDEVNSGFKLLSLEKKYEQKTGREYGLDKLVYQHIDKISSDKDLLNRKFIPIVRSFDSFIRKSENYKDIRKYLINRILSKILPAFSAEGIEIKIAIFIADLYAEYISQNSKQPDFVPDINFVFAVLSYIFNIDSKAFSVVLRNLMLTDRPTGSKTMELLVKMESNADSVEFWKAVLNAGLIYFEEAFEKGLVKTELLEETLNQMLKAGSINVIHCVEILILAFEKNNMLSEKSNMLLCACADIAKDTEIPELVKRISKVPIESQKQIFRHLDSRTSLKSSFLRNMDLWADSIGEIKSTASYIKDFCESICSHSNDFLHNRSKQILLLVLKEIDNVKNRKIRFCFFKNHPSYKDFLNGVAVFDNAEIHKKSMLLPDFEDKQAIYDYLTQYIMSVAKYYRGITEKKGWFSKNDMFIEGTLLLAESLLSIQPSNVLYASKPQPKNPIDDLVKTTGLEILRNVVKDNAGKKDISKIKKMANDNKKSTGIKLLSEWLLANNYSKHGIGKDFSLAVFFDSIKAALSKNIRK